MTSYLNTIKQFNTNLRFFFAATAVHSFIFFGIYTLLLNLYLLRLGYGSAFIGLVNGIAPLVLALASLPANFITTHIGCRKAIIVGYLFIAVGFLLLPLSSYVPESIREAWIVGSYALAWFSGSLMVVNTHPYIMGAAGEAEREHAFAIQSAIYPLFGFLGNLVGGFLPTFFANVFAVDLESAVPYRAALLLASVLYLFSAYAMKQTKEVAYEVSAITSHKPQSRIPLTFIFIIALVHLLITGTEWTLRIYTNVYLDTVLAVPTALIGGISAAGQLLGLVALLSPLIMARWGQRRTIIYGMLALGLIFLPIITIAHWTAVGFSFIGMIAMISLIGPAFAVYSQSNVAAEWRTSIASATTLAFGIGIALTALGGGQLVAVQGFQPLFLLAAVAPLLGAGLFGGYTYRKVAVAIPPLQPLPKSQ